MKRISIILIFALSLCSLGATDLEGLINDALAKSNQIKNIELSKTNSDLATEKSEVQPTLGVNVSASQVTFQEETAGKSFFSMDPAVTVTLPEYVEDMDISFGLKNSTRISIDGTDSLILEPDASLTKVFNLSSYTDSREDLTDSKNNLQKELNYQKSLLQFQNALIQDVISIMQQTSQIQEAKKSLERSEAELENDILLGLTTKGTAKELNQRMNISTSRLSVEGKETKLEMAKKTFMTNYGIDFQSVDTCKDAILDFQAMESGNTSVLLKALDLELAKQELEVINGTEEKLTLQADGSIPLTFNDWSYSDAQVNANLKASISGTSYSVSAKASAVYNGGKISPSLTFTGSWGNNTKAKADELETQRLANEIILAQMDYDSALESYKTEAETLINDIEDWKQENEQLAVKTQYHKQILTANESLLERGLISQQEYEDSLADVKSDEENSLIQKMNGLILENKIKIIQL